MADAPTRYSRRRRPLLGKGAQPPPSVARPVVVRPTTARPRDTEPDPSRIRRFGRRLMHQGETATREGDFTEAAVLFERAAWAYEYVNDPLAAAEAALELGRCLLYLGHGELLSALAGRIDNLAREAERPLPDGGLLQMRVWASILRKGAAEPSAFLQLIRMRRRARRAGAPRPSPPAEGGLPVTEGMPLRVPKIRRSS